MINNIKILIIDDEIKVINAFKRVFLKSNYEILSTTSPSQGMDLLDSVIVDIIICDYNMPDINGIEVLKHAKEVQPDAIRVLMTGLSDINIAISAINEGDVFYYLSKPWKNIELIAIIEKGLAEREKEKGERNFHQYMNDNRTYMAQLAERLEKTSKINNKQNKKFPLYEEQNIVLVDIQNILYITSLDGDIFVFTSKGEYESNDSLNTWEKKLSEGNFFRCHRSYIVNLEKIEKITPWFNGTYNLKLSTIEDTIPVSRSKTKSLKEILGL